MELSDYKMLNTFTHYCEKVDSLIVNQRIDTFTFTLVVDLDPVQM